LGPSKYKFLYLQKIDISHSLALIRTTGEVNETVELIEMNSKPPYYHDISQHIYPIRVNSLLKDQIKNNTLKIH